MAEVYSREVAAGLPGYDDLYPDWRDWWLCARFKEALPYDIPTPGHLQAMAAIVDGLGSPWNISTNWDRCKWYHTRKGAISFAYRSDVATHDFDKLTKLVLAAHAHCVRVEIEPCNAQCVRMIFWPRDIDARDNMNRHPTLVDLSERALSMAGKIKAREAA